jgi:hypothetical protein
MNEYIAIDVITANLVHLGYRMNDPEWLAFKHLSLGAAMVFDARELGEFIEQLHENRVEVVSNFQKMHDNIVSHMQKSA